MDDGINVNVRAMVALLEIYVGSARAPNSCSEISVGINHSRWYLVRTDATALSYFFLVAVRTMSDARMEGGRRWQQLGRVLKKALDVSLEQIAVDPSSLTATALQEPLAPEQMDVLHEYLTQVLRVVRVSIEVVCLPPCRPRLTACRTNSS